MKNLLCKLGIHDYFYDCFSQVKYRRFERHCMNCPKKQHRENKEHKWEDFYAN